MPTPRSHPKRCRQCKAAVAELLRQTFGAVEPNWASGWPCTPDAVGQLARVGPLLLGIHQALQAYRGFQAFVGRPLLPRCDFLVPSSPPFLVEFDEVQHFTEPRAITLERIPPDYPLGFDRAQWLERCRVLRQRDNDPPYRDEQRAWYDVLRDLLPSAYGLGPTVRLMDASTAFCELVPADVTAREAFRSLITRPIPPSA